MADILRLKPENFGLALEQSPLVTELAALIEQTPG